MQINTTGGTAGISTMLNTQNTQSNANPNKPKAFINIIFFDEQFKADKANKGIVRTYQVPNVIIDKQTGKPTPESLGKVMSILSKTSGDGTRIEGAYIESDKFKEMNEYAEKQLKENENPDREEYDLTSNNCGTFAVEVAQQDINIRKRSPKIVDPRPNSMVVEFQDIFGSVDYNPFAKDNKLSGTWQKLRDEKLIEASDYKPEWMKEKEAKEKSEKQNKKAPKQNCLGCYNN